MKKMSVSTFIIAFRLRNIKGHDQDKRKEREKENEFAKEEREITEAGSRKEVRRRMERTGRPKDP